MQTEPTCGGVAQPLGLNDSAELCTLIAQLEIKVWHYRIDYILFEI